ncbi:hypothetical protein [Methanosarcina acetivorans]|uniref:hypothetical protein n=1 Tax=Methanosarcina acetivorans TaxID=2214 RepID=UPI001D04DE7E|nr:hypothetical protein [Methanosarcina acetivorans]
MTKQLRLSMRAQKKVADYFLKHDQWTLFIISHDRKWKRDGVEIVTIGNSGPD